MRLRNDRATSIYWLVDVRPETLTAYPNGCPFYCGKTVKPIERRLCHHRHTATRAPEKILSRKLKECGEHVRTVLMETVPASVDWAARERHWIALLRASFPGCCVNVTDGGNGAPGMVQSSFTREKIRGSLRGKPHTAERNAKRSAALTGRKASEETRAKLRGRKHSEETRAKMRQARTRYSQKGRVQSAESRAKMSAGWARRRERLAATEARA